jgi:hypothetical protein
MSQRLLIRWLHRLKHSGYPCTRKHILVAGSLCKPQCSPNGDIIRTSKPMEEHLVLRWLPTASLECAFEAPYSGSDVHQPAYATVPPWHQPCLTTSVSVTYDATQLRSRTWTLSSSFSTSALSTPDSNTCTPIASTESCTCRA